MTCLNATKRLPVLFAALSALLMLAAAGVRAQESEPAGAAVARKVDEFGRLYGCDPGARLDNFAIELQNAPDSKAYVIGYDARRQAPGTARVWAGQLRQYLVEYRGIVPERVVTVEAGRHKGDELKIEFWLVPEGAGAPPVRPVKEKKNGARKFEGLFDAHRGYNDTEFIDTEGGGAGAYSAGVTFGGFAETLTKQPDSQGYIVVYSPPGSAPGFWRRIGTREREKLAAWHGLAAERVTVVNGGVNERDEEEEEETVVEYARIELWVGGRGKPPVKHVEEDEKLTEAVFVGATSAFEDGETEKRVNGWALKNLADAMRADPQSIGCIIVYPEDTSAPAYAPDAQDETESKPKPDPFMLAGSFKSELAKKHGIDERRLVVVTGPPSDWGSARLIFWAVPHGAPLPDPFAGEDEAEGEESEAEEETPEQF